MSKDCASSARMAAGTGSPVASTGSTDGPGSTSVPSMTPPRLAISRTSGAGVPASDATANTRTQVSRPATRRSSGSPGCWESNWASSSAAARTVQPAPTATVPAAPSAA